MPDGVPEVVRASLRWPGWSPETVLQASPLSLLADPRRAQRVDDLDALELGVLAAGQVDAVLPHEDLEDVQARAAAGVLVAHIFRGTRMACGPRGKEVDLQDAKRRMERMKWHLVYYQDEALGSAWRKCFGVRPDVAVVHADICQIECDAVVSPANSFGFMDGGLDYDLSERFGWHLQERLQREIAKRPLGELLVGEALIVPTHDPKVPWLISAPTMRVAMRLRQSVNAYLAMKAILTSAMSHACSPPIETVAIPGLGTGCGGLPAETAARQMWTAYREIVLKERAYPRDLGEAHGSHIDLNVSEVDLWD